MLHGLLENDGIKIINKVPGGRRLFPFFCYLVNIDELWLYQYHERNYGQVMENLFGSIQKLENEKWQMFESQTTEVIYEKAGTSRDKVMEAIDTRKPTPIQSLEMLREGERPSCRHAGSSSPSIVSLYFCFTACYAVATKFSGASSYPGPKSS